MKGQWNNGKYKVNKTKENENEKKANERSMKRRETLKQDGGREGKAYVINHNKLNFINNSVYILYCNLLYSACQIMIPQ